MGQDKNRPRRRPQQARSRFLFDAIVEATRQLIDEEGLDAATPTRVAERAGVSPGSLYQYFPGVEALVGEVIDERLKKDEAEVAAAMAGLDGMPLEQMIDAYVMGALAIFRQEQTSKALHTNV